MPPRAVSATFSQAPPTFDIPRCPQSPRAKRSAPPATASTVAILSTVKRLAVCPPIATAVQLMSATSQIAPNAIRVRVPNSTLCPAISVDQKVCRNDPPKASLSPFSLGNRGGRGEARHRLFAQTESSVPGLRQGTRPTPQGVCDCESGSAGITADLGAKLAARRRQSKSLAPRSVGPSGTSHRAHSEPGRHISELSDECRAQVGSRGTRRGYRRVARRPTSYRWSRRRRVVAPARAR